jgi:hypothetical protein
VKCLFSTFRREGRDRFPGKVFFMRKSAAILSMLMLFLALIHPLTAGAG